MEIKATLNKPYTKKQEETFRFVYGQNSRALFPECYEIRETETQLEAWGYTEEEKEEQEKERISNLTLTAADVERAIYKAKGMDFDDLVESIKESEITGFDVKRLKIELKANNFVRKHPYIDIVGEILGYTPEDMDYLFGTGELPTKDEELSENEE